MRRIFPLLWKPGLLPTLLFLFMLAGCAPTERLAAPGPPPATQPAPAETVETAEPVELDRAPEDWYHLDVQDDRVHGVSTARTYTTLLQGKQPQKKVIVAVIDSGVDIEHEDLRAKIWTNESEIPGNGIDDDDNGYVDDVHGWNFIGGPDGRNVDHDTYEVTRELVKLQPRHEGVNPAQLSAEDRAAYDYYLEIKDAYEQKLQQLNQLHLNFSAAEEAVRQATKMIRGFLGTENPTPEQIAAIRTEREDIQQAQGILLYLAQFGLDEQELIRQKKQIEGQIKYGFNKDFDPRSIVGDNYADPTERYYGNNDVAGPDPYHGTHVAGIIAADRDNRIGIDGIAGHVEIMVLRAVPNGDERDKDVANAIRYAVDNGADIINMSFGKSYSPEKEVVDAAVQYADEKGVLLVHGAGNDAEDLDVMPNFPSRSYLGGSEAARHWLEVGASSWEGTGTLAATFSNYGQKTVDLFAPGVSIYSTVPEQAYKQADGTSMAAPVVSGIAALIMSYYPDLTAAEVREILLQSAVPYAGQQVQRPGAETLVDFGQLSVTGSIVNAYRAIEMAEERSN